MLNSEILQQVTWFFVGFLLIAFSLVLLKKKNKKFHPKNMHILQSLSLGVKEKLVLVKIGDKQLLLGITPGKITCLDTFHRTESFSEMIKQEWLHEKP